MFSTTCSDLQSVLRPSSDRSFSYHYLANHVAARNVIDCLHSRNNIAENSVTAVKMRLRRMRDEPLRAAGIFSRERHANRAAFVRHLVYLATNLIAGAAIAITARIAILHNEVRDDTMHCDAVEIIALRELNEIVDG